MLDWRITLLHWITVARGRQFRPGASVAQVRAGYAELNRRFGMPPVAQVQTSVLTFPARDGARLSAHLHRPDGLATPSSVLLFFHGGGWVIGDVPSYDHLTRYFAHAARLAVISVEYRLGPEHRFPVAFEDGFDALGWLQREAPALGLDPRRIAVGGDSAGGGIAATLSAFAVAGGLARPAYQLLIYPPLDATERFPSRRAFDKGAMLTPQLRTWFMQNFFRSKADASNPWLRQIDAPDPGLLPPTYLLAAGYDALVDEGRYYADRLRSAGVPVVYDVRPTLAHGFVNFPRIVPEARRALGAAASALRGALPQS
ncbi:MAG TPA: alpha/beta hydrolase [Candidatus Baltobacteraceae bacterium]|nr:alpha/beta hydrolase [Candidatus Baltobacteraceae bacterium]